MNWLIRKIIRKYKMIFKSKLSKNLKNMNTKNQSKIISMKIYTTRMNMMLLNNQVLKIQSNKPLKSIIKKMILLFKINNRNKISIIKNQNSKINNKINKLKRWMSRRMITYSKISKMNIKMIKMINNIKNIINIKKNKNSFQSLS